MITSERAPTWGERLNPRTAFGLISVSAMLLFYALEEHSPWFVLAFAVASWTSALYAWLADARPITVVELIWGGVAVPRFRSRRV